MDLFSDNQNFIKEELNAFEAYIKSRLPRRSGFLNEVSRETILSGGKRLRPVLVLLSAMTGKYEREKAFPIAAAIEILHTATLVHDDIIDNAKTRRGHPTIAEKHSINIAVYTGDFLLAESVLLLAEAGLPQDKLEYVARAVRLICLGEINQYLTRRTLTSVSGYLRRIMKKTGILFSASSALGAFACGCSPEQVKLLARIGMYLGVAFQINDDLIDIESNEQKAGKPVGNDIREGVATLPYLYAAERSNKLRSKIEEYFGGESTGLDEIIAQVRTGGGVDDTRRLKQVYVDKCKKLLKLLPETDSRLAMNHLVTAI